MFSGKGFLGGKVFVINPTTNPDFLQNMEIPDFLDRLDILNLPDILVIMDFTDISEIVDLLAMMEIKEILPNPRFLGYVNTQNLLLP